jgi:hypothetical protein
VIFDACMEYECGIVASGLWPSGGRADWGVDCMRERGLRWEDCYHPYAQSVLRGLYALADEGRLGMPAADVLVWMRDNLGEEAYCGSMADLMGLFKPEGAFFSESQFDVPVREVRAFAAARVEGDRAGRLFEAFKEETMTAGGFLSLVDEVEREREGDGDGEGDGPVGMGAMVKEAAGWLQERVTGGVPVGVVPTGYGELDKAFGGGLQPGEYYVLAARPSVGKTALALNMLLKGAGAEVLPASGLLFSVEMPHLAVTLRLVAMESGVEIASVRDGLLTAGEWERYLRGMKRVEGLDVEVDDTGGVPLGDVVRRARGWARRRRKEGKERLVVMVDYLQLVTLELGRGATRENVVSGVSSGLKALAKNLGVPVVVMAQLNREAEKGGGKPKMSQLRESGAIEQDADGVWLLHRDQAEGGEETELIIGKNRNGPLGTIRLWFEKGTNVFREGRRVADEDVPVVEVEPTKRAPKWMGGGG